MFWSLPLMNFNHILINEDYVTLDIRLISYSIMGIRFVLSQL